jgi:hypothetical protein
MNMAIHAMTTNIHNGICQLFIYSNRLITSSRLQRDHAPCFHSRSYAQRLVNPENCTTTEEPSVRVILILSTFDHCFGLESPAAPSPALRRASIFGFSPLVIVSDFVLRYSSLVPPSGQHPAMAIEVSRYGTHESTHSPR